MKEVETSSQIIIFHQPRYRLQTRETITAGNIAGEWPLIGGNYQTWRQNGKMVKHVPPTRWNKTFTSSGFEWTSNNPTGGKNAPSCSDRHASTKSPGVAILSMVGWTLLLNDSVCPQYQSIKIYPLQFDATSIACYWCIKLSFRISKPSCDCWKRFCCSIWDVIDSQRFQRGRNRCCKGWHEWLVTDSHIYLPRRHLQTTIILGGVMNHTHAPLFLDFPVIKGFPFRNATFWGKSVVWGRELIWPETYSNHFKCWSSWWSNHLSEKYARQIGSWNPRDRGENSKHIWVATTEVDKYWGRFVLLNGCI